MMVLAPALDQALMKHWLTRFSLFSLAVVVAPIATPQANVTNKAVKDTAQSGRIARGSYIVNDLVLCTQCHTPVDENGQKEASQFLMGGPIQIRPTYPSPDWAQRAPRIAGRPPGTDADFIKLMMTGIARTGRPPDPPMIQPHMTREDAESVLAYLKSLSR